MAMDPSDMSGPPRDLAMIDMAMVPTLTPLSGCAAAMVTTATVYSNIISSRCAKSNCHGGNIGPNMSGGAAAFSAAVVNVTARPQLTNFDEARPNDPNNSFILYKVTGQQSKVPFGGSRMPADGPPYLTAADQCLLYNWIQSGAQ
jgi:hypothetical protein